MEAYKGQLFRRDRWSRWPGYTLFRLKNPQISPQRPDRMTPDGEASWKSRSDAAVNSNLRRILRELNQGQSQDRALRLDPVGQQLSQHRENRAVGLRMVLDLAMTKGGIRPQREPL